MTKKDYINDEYNRAKVRYEALKLLKEGSVSPEPTPTPTPAPEPTPTPKPVSTEPEIVYSGKSEIVLAVGESVKFSIYVNNVTSSRDYSVETVGDPTFYDCDEVGYKTDCGYRLDFVLKGKSVGRGSIKVYLTKERNKRVDIAVMVK